MVGVKACKPGGRGLISGQYGTRTCSELNLP